MFAKLVNEDSLNQLRDYKDEVVEGLKTMFGLDDNAVAKDVYSKSIHADSVSSLLPYLGWNEEAALFILDEGDKVEKKGTNKKNLGFCLECVPQSGADDSMESILQSIYIQSPPGTSISVHNYASPDVMDKLKLSSNLRYSDSTMGIEKHEWEKRNVNIYQRMSRKRIDFFLNGTSKPLWSDSSNVMIRDFRVVISVVVPSNPKSDKDIQSVMLLKEQISSTLNSANLPSWAWTPDNLINFVSDLFDHSRMLHVPSKEKKEYSPIEKIRRQVVGREVSTEVTSTQINVRNSMSADETSIVQLSVTQYPKNFHLAMMSSLIGDYFQGALAYPCPFMITTSAIVQDYDGTRQKAAIKTASSTRKAEGYLAKVDPVVPEEAFEWKQALKAIDDGGTLIKIMTNVTLVCPKEKAGKVRSEVTAIWRSNGFRLADDRYQQLVSFLCCLPMNLTPSMISDVTKMSRLSTKYSQNAISLSPFIGEWKGSGTPVLSFIGRRGQLVSLDLFDNNAGNYNFAIVGASGSGKSFVTQEVLMGYRANQSKIWVIDVGRSYQSLCHLLDGDFIEFTEKADICINPFTGIVDIVEEMSMLKPLISTMMSPGKPLPAWERSKLEQGVQEVFAKKGTKMTITNLSEYFLNGCGEDADECDPRLRDMGVMLYPWTKEGAYGKYFEGDANISFTNDFTVLELEELKNKKELQQVVMLIMLYKISQEMYFSRDQKKLVMIDEAWQLLGGDADVAEFIETGYRRARKYRAAFGTATQSYEDYYTSPGALAALRNADWTFTLRQKEESVGVLIEKGLLGLKDSPYRQRSLRGLRKEDGKFSEMFISYPEGSGVVRFIADPFSQLLYSSKAEHFDYIEKRKEEGYDVGEAVQMAMKHFNIVEPAPITYK